MTLHTDSTADLLITIDIVYKFYNLICTFVLIIIVVEQGYLILKSTFFKLFISKCECFLHINRFQIHIAVHIHPAWTGWLICAVNVLICHIPCVYKASGFSGKFNLFIHHMIQHCADKEFKTRIHHFRCSDIFSVVILGKEPVWCLLVPHQCVSSHFDIIFCTKFQRCIYCA